MHWKQEQNSATLYCYKIGERCNMSRISSFRVWSRLDTPMIPRSILISVVAIFLLLFTFIAHHSLPYFRAGLSILSLWAWGESSGRTILRSIVSSLTMQPAREGPRLCMSVVPSLSITDPRCLKLPTWFSYSPFSCICNGVCLVDKFSVFATLIFRASSVKTFCHDSSLLWMNDNEYIA